MDCGQAADKRVPDQSGRATLNEVLFTEIGALRPSLVQTQPATFAKSADEITANLKEIYAAVATLGTETGPGGADAQPLSAICFSGGGIRSATFNLGVIQGLAKIGLLGKFDYLSSVSGGGYIASWLRTWMHRESVAQVVSTLSNRTAPGNPLAPEPTPLVNLRAYSNYLTPKLGLFSGDTWAAAAVISRNLILNWLVLIPVIAAVIGIPLLFLLVVNGSLISELLYPHLLWAAVAVELIASLSVYACRRFAKRAGTSQFFFIGCCVLPICLAAAMLCTAALGLQFAWQDSTPHPCCSDLTALWKFSAAWCVVVPLIGWAVVEVMAFLVPSWTQYKAASGEVDAEAPTRATMRQRARQAAWVCEIFALVISGSVGTVLLVGAVRLLFPPLITHPPLYVILALPVILGIYLVSRVLFVGLANLADSANPKRSRGSSDDADREWWARLSGWVLLVLTVWIGGTAVCIAGIYLPGFIRDQVGNTDATVNKVKALVAVIGTVSGLLSALTGSSAKTAANDNSRAPKLPISLILLVQAAGVIFIVSVILSLSWGLRALAERVVDPDLFTVAQPWPVWLAFLCLLSGLVLGGVIASRIVNVNRFSLHGMYRNRLVRAYLGASNGLAGRKRTVDPFTGFALNDNIALRCLASAEVRPLPILNATLNLVQGANLAWQQRKAESFSMTPFFCGSWSEGYRNSSVYGGPGGITVGTAMTISGAAVNPNMGYNSSPVLAFIMGIFNVRLGAWLGNPNIGGNKGYANSGPKLALMPLFAELFGMTNTRRRYVNLSDGGHFENLGLYEVVLRRCRHVMVSDAACDLEYGFADLGNAIRKIRIDFGIPIDFTDKILIEPNSSKEPGMYCAIANIGYSAVGSGPDGTLVYIKPTLQGRILPDQSVAVPYDVYSYSKGSGTFPHETTLDQWFSESQFESYRELGSYILGRVGGSLADASFEQFLTNARDCIRDAKP